MEEKQVIISIVQQISNVNNLCGNIQHAMKKKHDYWKAFKANKIKDVTVIKLLCVKKLFLITKLICFTQESVHLVEEFRTQEVVPSRESIEVCMIQ